MKIKPFIFTAVASSSGKGVSSRFFPIKIQHNYWVGIKQVLDHKIDFKDRKESTMKLLLLTEILFRNRVFSGKIFLESISHGPHLNLNEVWLAKSIGSKSDEFSRK